MNKIFIYNLGCKLRLLDAQLLFDYFTLNGYTVVDRPKKADVIILFTCGVTEELFKGGLKAIKKFQKNQSAELIVAGCLPALHNKEISRIFQGKTILTKDIDKNPEKLDALFPGNKIKFADIKDVSRPLYLIHHFDYLGYRRFIKTFQRNNNSKINKLYLWLRDTIVINLFGDNSITSKISSKNSPYPIRISWGCYGNCSYCAIKKAIGKFHSKSVDEIIEELKKGLRQGFSNIFLIADSTGEYGLDIGSSFPELLDKLTEIPGDYGISVINLHPSWIDRCIDELEIILKKQKIKRLDIPIQSSSERILKLMNRFSDVKKMEENFYRLKTAYPNLCLTTHLIAGFPTETEEELRQTLNFIKKVGISSGQLLPFSCKSDTKAERLEPKLTNKEIIKRKKYSKKILKKLGYRVIPVYNNYNFY